MQVYSKIIAIRFINKYGAKERSGYIWLRGIPSSRLHKRGGIDRLNGRASIILPRWARRRVNAVTDVQGWAVLLGNIMQKAAYMQTLGALLHELEGHIR